MYNNVTRSRLYSITYFLATILKVSLVELQIQLHLKPVSVSSYMKAIFTIMLQ